MAREAALALGEVSAPFRRPVCLHSNSALAGEIMGHMRGAGAVRARLLPEFVHANAFLESVAALAPSAPSFAEVVSLAAGWRSAKWAGVASDSALQIELFELMRNKNYFRGVALFSAMREIVSLLKEIDDKGVRMPESLDEFQEMLESEHDRRALGAVAKEAELVIEMWFQLAKQDERLRNRAQGLKLLESKIDLPLVVIDTGEFPACLKDFIESGRSENVRVLSPKLGEAGATLFSAWGGEGDEPEPAACGANGSFAHCRLIEGSDFEAAATLAVEEVRRHAREGRERIGIVVFDRVLARRVQAVAAEDRVFIEDRSGWVSSTLMVGSMLLLYCDLVNDEAEPRAFEDFIASPGSFSRGPKGAGGHAVDQLRMLRAKGNLRPGNRSDSKKFLEELRMSRTGMQKTRFLEDVVGEISESPMRCSRALKLRDWISRLLEAVRKGALGGVFRGDAPAREITAMLAAHLRSLEHVPTKVSYREFRSWLHDLMEENFIAPASGSGPVSFVSLGQAWLRSYDALVVLGASAANFPTAPEFVFFNGSLRGQLGLDDEAKMIAAEKRKMAALLENHPHASVVWPKVDLGGQVSGESPLFEIACATPWGMEKVERLDRPRLPRPGEMECPPARISDASAPAAGLLGESFSVSNYEGLMTCPFRLYAERLLRPRLREDEEEMSAAEFGKIAHKIMEKWGEEAGSPGLAGREAKLRSRLESISEREFAGAAGEGVRARLALEMFKRSIPELARMEAQQHREGWKFAAAEFKVEASLGAFSEDGTETRLSGKIDRIDRREDKEGAFLSVTDYKTSASNAIRQKAKDPGESPQVAIYAHLLENSIEAQGKLGGGKVEKCGYVGLRERKNLSHSLDLRDDVPKKLHDRLILLLGQIADGAPLKANALQRECKHCPVEGVCRRPFWIGPAGAPPGLEARNS